MLAHCRVGGMNAVKEKLRHGIRQTNERLKLQGEKIEDFVKIRNAFIKGNSCLISRKGVIEC
jgi:hypothetical protein